MIDLTNRTVTRQVQLDGNRVLLLMSGKLRRADQPRPPDENPVALVIELLEEHRPVTLSHLTAPSQALEDAVAQGPSGANVRWGDWSDVQ